MVTKAIAHKSTANGTMRTSTSVGGNKHKSRHPSSSLSRAKNIYTASNSSNAKVPQHIKAYDKSAHKSGAAVKLTKDDVAEWEQLMVEKREQMYLPKASQIITDLRPTGVTFLISNIAHHIDVLENHLERYPQALHEADDFINLMDTFFLELNQSMIAYLNSIPHDLPENSNVSIEASLNVPATIRDCYSKLSGWLGSLMRYLSYMKHTEEKISEHIKVFKAMEEENTMYKEILAQHSLSLKDITVVTLKRIVDVPRITTQLVHREVNTDTENNFNHSTLERWRPRNFRVPCLSCDAKVEMNSCPSQMHDVTICLQCRHFIELGKQMTNLGTPKNVLSINYSNMDNVPPHINQMSTSTVENDKRKEECLREVSAVPQDNQIATDLTLLDVRNHDTNSSECNIPTFSTAHEITSVITREASKISDDKMTQTDDQTSQEDILQMKHTDTQTICLKKTTATQTPDHQSCEMLDIDHSAARISGISEDISQVVVSSAQYKTLETSLAAKNAECVTLEATLTTFKHEMETATNTITQLLKSQGDLHSLLANAQSQISTLTEQQIQMSHSLAESQRSNEQHMFEIQGAQTALRNFQTDAQAEIENKKVEILTKESENKKLKGDIRDYQHQLDNLQREIISYKTRVDELTAHYYESESKNTDATRKIEELESKLHTIMKFPDVSLANVNIEETETDDAELSEMIDANNSRISILESKNNEFRALKVRRASNVSLSSEFKRSAVSSPTLLFDKLPNQSSTHLKIASAPSSRRQSVQADTIAHSEPSLSNNSKLAHWKSSQQTLKDANSFNINGLLKASLNALHSANKVSSGNSRASNRSSFSSRPSSGLRKGSTAVKESLSNNFCSPCQSSTSHLKFSPQRQSHHSPGCQHQRKEVIETKFPVHTVLLNGKRVSWDDNATRQAWQR